MCDQQIIDILSNRKCPTLSLEFFPPKDALGFGILGGSIERMRTVQPDFVTCTYGAGGATRGNSATAWALLSRMGFNPVAAHLTCVGASVEDLTAQIHAIYQRGIRNIVALRGDPPKGEAAFVPAPDGLKHASDLVALIKRLHPDICCGVAGYPETHPEAVSPAEDILNLKAKLDAGADFVDTQLFYDNRSFFAFADACRAAGITAPILPGLMPATSLEQVRRTIAMSRVALPAELERELTSADADKEAARAVGMRWLIRQIEGLIAAGVPGIHLYILNQAKTILDPALAACIAKWRTPKETL